MKFFERSDTAPAHSTSWGEISLRTEPRTPNEQERMTVLQIQTVIRSSPKNLFTGIVGAFIIACLGWFGSGQNTSALPWPWIWWLLISAGLACGTYIAHRFNARPRSSDETFFAAKCLMRTATYCGIAWGSAAWLLLPVPSLQSEALIMVTIAMVLMGGAASSALYRPWLYLFLFPATGVFILGLLRLGEYFYVVMSVAIVLLTFVILAAARIQEGAVKAAILAGFETEALLKERINQQALTDKARADAEMAREEAELANQGKTTFLAAAGHDLRQPMHALVQYFGHLRRRNRDTDLDETISRIGKSLDAMQDLLDTILEVSKLMMGSVKPTVATFKVSDLLDRLDAQMRPIAEDKGLRFEVSGVDCYMQTDEVLLERILRNLTLNAIRYTNHGRVLVRAKSRGQKVVIQVFDTGIGIPKNQRELIFEAFYQVGNEARNRQKGLGLGLAIVKQLSDLLSISVRVRSRKGGGSIFSVELPVVARRAEAEGLAVIPRSDRDFVKGAFVVLIDDNIPSLEATAASLAEFGCRVVTATSGLEAIERLQGQEFMPHLVISDYRLEGETGLEAIKMVVENQQALFGDDFAIPALVISGDTAPAELEKVQKAGFTMLHKPVRLEVLYKAVNGELEALAMHGVPD